MNIVDFVALVFAAGAVVDVWRNGSLFDEGRAIMEATADRDDEDVTAGWSLPSETEPAPWYWRVVPAPVAAMLNCAFCFSHHTPWVLALLFYFPALFVTAPWLAFLLKLPVYSLAATRLGTIINAWAPGEAQYDRGTPRFTIKEDHTYDD
jgi:hypothetical protein